MIEDNNSYKMEIQQKLSNIINNLNNKAKCYQYNKNKHILIVLSKMEISEKFNHYYNNFIKNKPIT